MKLLHTTKLVLLAFCIAAIAYPGCKSEQKLALRFNPEKNKKYEFVMTTNQDIEGEQAGQKIQMKNNMTFTYDMLVTENDGKNNIVMVSTFKKIKMNTSGAGPTDISYDSENTGEDGNLMSAIYRKAFGALIGKSITMVIDEKGNVTALTGMGKIFDEMMTSMGLDTLPQAAMMVETMKKSFNDETFKKSFEEMFKIFPDKEVKVGDTWDKTVNKDVMGMAMDTKTKYELKDIDNKMATVSLSGTLDIGKGATPMPGMDMTMNGTQTGAIKIDIKTGLTTEGEINQDLTMTQKAMGMEIPMKLKSVIKLSSKEVM